MLSKILIFAFFTLSCGVKKAPTSTNKVPSVLQKYLEKKEVQKKK